MNAIDIALLEDLTIDGQYFRCPFELAAFYKFSSHARW